MPAVFLRRIQPRTLGDLFVFAEAYVTLGLMRVLLSRRTFAEVVRFCGLQLLHNAESIPPPVDAGEQNEANTVAWAIAAAARRTPWESACLAQALAAALLLSRRGIPGHIVLGVRIPADATPDFAAHAWVLVGEQTLVGAQAHRRYTPIAAYTILPSPHD